VLLEQVRSRTGVSLDEKTLTIGFARRATQYKRPDLLFSNLDRLKWIVLTPGLSKCCTPAKRSKAMRPMHIGLDATKRGSRGQNLVRNLLRLVIGQDEAIQAIVNAYQLYLSGLNAPGRPIANFLFLGPTGSVKTRASEATAEPLLGDSRAVVKVDCGEFQHGHEISKLVGSPPGYMGHRETHALVSQEALNQHFTANTKISFVLFDEIEKASDTLWNLLLGFWTKGRSR
jgi:ATP-dependent Clp protease ATP-binding subunit ClpA